ncbi:MAG TPA: HAD family phosphatase [Corynebacteriales bacterium]|nr:HAD family phosphatase [Mycobacteriales bacterium]
MSTNNMPPLLFDCFGVIAKLQTPAYEQRIYGIALGEEGAEADSIEELFTLQRFGKVYRALRKPYDAGTWDAPTYWEHVAEELGVEFSDTQIVNLTAMDLESWDYVDESMVDYLGELDAAGYPMGLLSNIPVELAEIFRVKPWLKHFDSVTWSCDIGHAKPDKEAFQHAADEMGCQLEELTFIDDTQENVDAAAKLGIRTHFFTGEEELREFITSLTAEETEAAPTDAPADD